MLRRQQRTTLPTLLAACAIGGVAQALTGAAGGLLAQRVSGSDATAGLPQTALVIGGAAAAVGLSALTRRHGRRRALAFGTTVAVAGCALIVLAAQASALPLLLAGFLLLGSGNSAVMLARYAAADLAPAGSRARAMATVLAATTVGAVIGPNLMVPASAAGEWIGQPELGGVYLLGAHGFATATVLLGSASTRPEPVGEPRQTDPATALDPTTALGLAVLAIANLVMVGVTTMAPVQLHHMGVGLGAIGLVVSLHIAGMFAPSPLSGWLADRYGSGPTVAVAGVVLAVASVVAGAGAGDPVVLTAGMALLGVGWNVALLAGSALLTAGPVAGKARREGWGEVGMGLAAAGGGAAAGPVMGGGGYPLLAVAGAGAAVLVLPIAWALRRAVTRS
ncbi:MFS transporter [Pseudonocardia sp. GCM10023141]|uniref:MFS transporter n=1 Tax=Pseudonocardia sp. GCM10023141 TaxID=3252653 RepID=UPI003614903A